MIPLCLNGNSSRIGMRSSARRWFSQVTWKKMLSQPSPKSGGKVSRTRSGRFVSRKNFTSGRAYMIIPSLCPPCIGFREKEIGGHADSDEFAALYPVFSALGALQWVVKVIGAVDFRTVRTTPPVKGVHIAIGATLANTDAAMPRIPYIMHRSASRQEACASLQSPAVIRHDNQQFLFLWWAAGYSW